MRYRITHRTTYTYPVPAHDSFNEVRLRPVSNEHQTCLDFNLHIDPPASVIAYPDYWDNAVHEFGIPYLHDSLTIEATSDIITFADANQPLDPKILSHPEASLTLEEMLTDEIFIDDHAEYLIPSTYVALEPLTRSISDEIIGGNLGMTARDFVLAAADWVQERITYRIGTTNVHSTVLEVLEGGSGVCQDFSHLLISLCRHAGVPARYVSGYLGDVTASEASHAWVEALVPPYGWVSLDATHDGLCTGRHVKLGAGRDYADVTIVRGTYRGGESASLQVSVTSEEVDGERGMQMAGKQSRGKLVHYQAMGGAGRWRSLEGSLSAMSQTTGRLGGRQGGVVLGNPEPPQEGDIPLQQPQQQQQGRRG